jgi:beta-lactamase regulating signal transducer with metallopeptidase domain
MNPLAEPLAWALLHFLWQGTLIAVAAGIAAATFGRRRPSTRYGIYCAALALMLAVPAIVFFAFAAGGPPALETASASPTPAAAFPAPPPSPPARPAPGWIPALLFVWLTGVAFQTLRGVGGWILAQRLRRWKVTPAAECFDRTARRLAARLAVRRPVRILQSAAAEVPAAIGWLRPVILLPVSAITALTPEQIEVLIAHELAHIRRHDYLVNLIQVAVETVLFYHPAVWWIGSRIRAEREHCCDDLAVAVCGNPVHYARTLATLEGLRHAPLAPAMAADGGSLRDRIMRLLRRDGGAPRHLPPAWLGALLPVAVILLAVFAVDSKSPAVTPVAELASISTPAPAPLPPAVAPGEDLPAPASEAPLPGEPALNPPALPVDPDKAQGYLGGLAAVGYTGIGVDEIIALKENGVEPPYIGRIKAAGLGVPSVRDLINIKQHGVEPELVAAAVRSGLLRDLSFETVIRLRDNGVDCDDLFRIRSLGFGPFSVDEVVKLRQQGVTSRAFEALKEAGITQAGVREAQEVQDHGITAERIRALKSQGFANLNLEQIVKLRRAGII